MHFSHLVDVIIPWESTNRVDYMALSFLDSRLQYESVEVLMDFLAFLVQTLWQNKQKLIRGIPTKSLENSYKIWDLSAVNFAPKTSGSRCRPLKTHITA